MAKFKQTYPTDQKYSAWQQIERTLAWLNRFRRLARDYEHSVSSSEAMKFQSCTRPMLELATK
jgi:transposase